MSGEMSIKGYVDSAEVDVKLGGSDSKAFVEKVAAGMKENPGKCPDLDLGVKTIAEALKKARQLNNQRYKMGSAYAKIAFVVTGKDDSDFKVYAKECEPAKRSKAKKKSLPAGSVAGASASAEDGIKQLIQQIEAGQMPDAVLPGILKKYEQLISAAEQKLSAQGIAEADAAKWKSDIELMRTAVEAIKKKLAGNQG